MFANLRKVFLCLRTANLKLNSFFERRVKYLEHIISKDNITTNPEMIKSVQEWPVPRSKKQVRSFLGFCSYYRKFVKGFSLVAKRFDGEL